MQEMKHEINEPVGSGAVTFQEGGKEEAVPLGEAWGLGARAGGEGQLASLFSPLAQHWGNISGQEGEMT